MRTWARFKHTIYEYQLMYVIKSVWPVRFFWVFQPIPRRFTKVLYSHTNKEEVYACRCTVCNIVANEFSALSFERCVHMEFLDRINDFDAIFITPVNRYSADLWLLSLILVGATSGVNWFLTPPRFVPVIRGEVPWLFEAPRTSDMATCPS